MSSTTVDEVMQKLSRATLVVGMATAVVAAPLATLSLPRIADAATSVGGEATISVTVESIKAEITQINGSVFDNPADASSVAIKTYDAKNEVHFKTDEDAHVKIMLGDEVVWEGDTKADQPAVAEIDLTGKPIGVYQFTLMAYYPDGTGGFPYNFWLDYQATIPSIIPGGDINAPNTGLYVTIGGRVYSMTTLAIVLILAAVAVFLAASRGRNHEMAKAKARAKSNRKNMDMI